MSSPCCPVGAWPALKAPEDYQPLGEVIKVPQSEDAKEELLAYTVGASDAEKAILVFPEVFCWEVCAFDVLSQEHGGVPS